MATTGARLPTGSFGSTMRPDSWWLQPLLVLLFLSGFIIYTTWAAFQGEHYHYGPYLSPLYAPEVLGSSPHSWFGPKPGWWPLWLPFSPAFLILWAPGGFRVTCYYYRGAYYKAFWADPPSCTVSEPRNRYRGENFWPLLIQNCHRYFLYLALLWILVFFPHDVWKAFWFVDNTTGQTGLGVGVGTLVLAINLVLLGGYVFSCHSLRHLVGGKTNEISKSPLRLKSYNCVSCLNRRHSLWAWCSMLWVSFSDIYVRLCSMGVWTDWRIL